jgi:hypothetical protein
MPLKFTLLALFSVITVFVSAQDSSCIKRELGDVPFKNNSIRVTSQTKRVLDSLITVIQSHPECLVLVSGYFQDHCEQCGSGSFNRAQAVINYFSRKGIPNERLAYTIKLEGGVNKIVVSLTPRSPGAPPEHHH